MQKCPNKFREGDVVIGVDSHDGKYLTGITGTIRLIDGDYYGVVWDKFIHGHMLSGTCEDGYGWWVSGDVIEPYNISLENK